MHRKLGQRAIFASVAHTALEYKNVLYIHVCIQSFYYTGTVIPPSKHLFASKHLF